MRLVLAAVLTALTALGCGSGPEDALFGDGNLNVGNGGGPTSTGHTSTSSGPASSSSGSGTAGMGGSGSSGSSASSAGGDQGGGGSGGAQCQPQACPDPSYCGTWPDGCGGESDCPKLCDIGQSCGADNQCHACTPSLTQAQVCAGGKCGFYIDECGILQNCDGFLPGGQCPVYQVCPSDLDPQQPSWNEVPSCFGCTREGAMDALCGNIPTPYAFSCPSEYHNGIQDSGESDVDCGGPNPSKCASGKACYGDMDCDDMLCQSGSCANTNASQDDCLYLGNFGIWCCPVSQ